jgi:hypothetical protein
MYPDFKDLLSSFNAHSVKYLIVGGHAVSLHAQPRATKDLDVFIKADSANAHATCAALASYGALSRASASRIWRTHVSLSASGESLRQSTFCRAIREAAESGT